MVKDYMKYLIAKAVANMNVNNRILQNPTQHPMYVYRGKSKTFKRNKRRGL